MVFLVFVFVEFVDVSVGLVWLVVGSMCFFIVGFVVGWGFIFWLFMLEIFFLYVKGVVIGICVFINWFMVFFVIKEFSSFMEVFRFYGVFWFVFVFCIFSVFFILFCVFEIKGKILE